tara:strand:+ start:144 stop:332 length:189 start_codon:yes stop_codon:yes gene_type:complete
MNYSFREIFKEEKPFVGVVTIESVISIEALDKQDFVKKVKDTWKDLHDIELTDEEITEVEEK